MSDAINNYISELNGEISSHVTFIDKLNDLLQQHGNTFNLEDEYKKGIEQHKADIKTAEDKILTLQQQKQTGGKSKRRHGKSKRRHRKSTRHSRTSKNKSFRRY